MRFKNIPPRIFYLLLFFVLSACTNMETLDQGLTPKQIVEKVNPGEEIIVHTKDNEKHIIVVESITTEKITGSGKSFDFEQITEIKKEGIDGWKTTGAVLGSLYIYSAIAGLLIVAAL